MVFQIKITSVIIKKRIITEVEFMKKYIMIFMIMLLSVLILTSCKNEEIPENPQDEISSVLSDTNISNADKTEIISKMADDEIARAEKYKKLIEAEYNERENAIEYEHFSFDSAYQTLDDYCEYLENEFNNNIEFFNDFATVKYQGGSYSGIWLSEKQYECAKDYADKMQALYEELS